MIEAKNISKYFDGTRILHDVSATFESGKTNLIIGQSGSGKTVFMKCLIGLHTPEQGEIFYDNRPFTRMSANQRKVLRTEIGMLFQGSALFDNETVLGNVMFPLKMFSPMTRKEQIERAQFCIRRVGLEKHCEACRAAYLTVFSLCESLVLHGIDPVVWVGSIDDLSDKVEV